MPTMANAATRPAAAGKGNRPRTLMPARCSRRSDKNGTGRWQVGQLVVPAGTVVPQIMQKSVGEGVPLETAPIPRTEEDFEDAPPAPWGSVRGG